MIRAVIASSPFVLSLSKHCPSSWREGQHFDTPLRGYSVRTDLWEAWEAPTP